jgi:cyclin D1/2/4
MSRSPDYSAGDSLCCGEDAGEVASWVADTWISHRPPSSLFAYAPPSDESTVSMLIDSEPQHVPHPDYLRRCRDRSIDITARQDSINWILKVRTLSPTYQNTYMYTYRYWFSGLVFVRVTQVHAYYRFRPVTAFLSVNYLDRFLSSHSLRVW